MLRNIPGNQDEKQHLEFKCLCEERIFPRLVHVQYVYLHFLSRVLANNFALYQGNRSNPTLGASIALV